MISVYNYQIEKAQQFLDENGRYNSDKDIYAKYFELKTILQQNKELVDFLTPRASNLYYTKAVSLIADGKKQEAYEYLQKAIATKKDNIMAQYELSKMSLDSNQILSTANRLTDVLTNMNPTEEEKQLCKTFSPTPMIRISYNLCP